VDVGDVDAKASRVMFAVGQEVTPASFSQLISKVAPAKQGVLAEFLVVLYAFFVKLNYSYLEINPIVVTEDRKVVPLDLAAKIDETAKVSAGQTRQ
jgi:ATP citrate (pro-S)-lyase